VETTYSPRDDVTPKGSGRRLRYAIHVHLEGACADPKRIVDFAREAEDSGWDGFFVTDHLGAQGPSGALSVADPWIALAAVATATQRLRIGPMVAALPRYRPWQLALAATTLDHLSGGRLVLGVGSGTRDAQNFVPFTGPSGEVQHQRTRGHMLDEALAVIAGLWNGEPFSYAGKHYRVDGATMLPRPLQRSRIPIWVAGTWPHRRPFRRAARWDGCFADVEGVDWLNGGIMAPDELREIVGYLREERRQRGGSVAAEQDRFDVVIGGRLPEDRSRAAATLAPYAEAGLTWWVEGVLDAFGTPEELRRKICQGPPAG
jgi:alkanesulfonate monooxygenase SsuD/methylene tetrahydromethanopterin reductase-like flavin-dependent oxidoreductase (luciferase family)